MHPAVIVIPVAVLIFAPQLWVRQVMKRHNRQEEADFPTGGELARALLARHQLHGVRVERTDIGDHYDPKTKAVRLSRDKYNRKTLTAMTTAAHEVAHAIQDASNYGPFIWRMRLVKLAQVVGQAGTIVIVAVPVTAILTRHYVPPMLIGSAILAMVGTGMAAQVAALPTELDASFARAMPMLRDGYISEAQSKNAREILIASSLTYVVASLLAVLNIWPWLGAGPARVTSRGPIAGARLAARGGAIAGEARVPAGCPESVNRQLRRHGDAGILEGLVRQFGKPMIRKWFQIRYALS